MALLLALLLLAPLVAVRTAADLVGRWIHPDRHEHVHRHPGGPHGHRGGPPHAPPRPR